MESVRVNWISGNRKNKLAEVKDYLFEKNKNINGGASYRCLNYKSCPAKLHVLVNGSTLFGQHNHPTDPDKIAARKIIAKGKETAVASRFSNMASIMQSVEDEALRSNLNASYLGRTNSLKRRFNDAKMKVFGHQSLGETLQTLEIPESFQKTLRNDRFLLYDNKDHVNRIIIYASDDSLDKLSYCDTWLIDGTFKTCPSIFHQIYTVHGIYRNSLAVPFVYVYLPGKSREIYKEAFQVIRQKTPNEPACIISDFETAAILASKEIFIATELSGCLFHLTQSIYRRVQQCPDVYRRYMGSDEDARRVKVAIRSLGALAFLPKEEVPFAFIELRGQFRPTDPVREIFSYFQNNYIGNSWADVRYPICFWNVLERFRNSVPRTNNAKEGWHYRFNSIHPRLHPSMASSIEKLQTEENHWFQECQKIRSGFVNRRKTKYNLLDQRLREIVSGYEAQIYTGYLDFLEAIQCCLHQHIQESG